MTAPTTDRAPATRAAGTSTRAAGTSTRATGTAAELADRVERALERAVAGGEDSALLALEPASCSWVALDRLRAHVGAEVEELRVRRAGSTVMVDLALRPS